VARRPDLVAAERRLAATGERLVQARRSLYPRLTLTASGGTATEQFANLLDGNFGVWSLAAGLLPPLYQGGRLRAGVDVADAADRETLERYASTVLAAYAEVETALSSEVLLEERRQHLADAAEQTSAALRLSDERYKIGIGDFLSVLESQTRELTAASELLAVRRQILDNRIDLYLALGGGFETPWAEPLRAAADDAPTGK